MFARSYRVRPFGRVVEIDLYTPRAALDKRGLDLHADTVFVLRRQYRGWCWVLGFGLALALPR